MPTSPLLPPSWRFLRFALRLNFWILASCWGIIVIVTIWKYHVNILLRSTQLLHVFMNISSRLTLIITITCLTCNWQLQCCGADGPVDFLQSSWFNKTREWDGVFVPVSCCQLIEVEPITPVVGFHWTLPFLNPRAPLLMDALLMDALLMDALLMDALLMNALLMNALLMDALLMDALLMDGLLMNETTDNKNILVNK